MTPDDKQALIDTLKNAVVSVGPAPGQKFDAGKTRWELLPLRVLRGVARVLSFGAAKYAANSWQAVPDAVARYKAALDRHWASVVLDGEENDPESGIEHAYHFACNALFLAWFLVFRKDLVRQYAESQEPRPEPIADAA